MHVSQFLSLHSDAISFTHKGINLQQKIYDH